ncbi:sulfurtransferase [Stappia sp. GBMRC 2046]|uniref:Sulfurtransferase n=1 Tax=Stappia sediminis TaxID=2692190 RepID=A0A7X3LUA6_9HYPH|nr:sulfurtransferase/chromate resistance protein [Stappia sediminis]MXN65255.1 sulfurtransferase [Stappia sediminis]
MPSNTEITVSQLARLIGTPEQPRLIDVRDDEDFCADPRLVPGASRTSPARAAAMAHASGARKVVVICQKGRKLSQGAAAWMRHHGLEAETLEGGFEAWREGGGPLVPFSRIPPPGESGASVWVTRARPKIDRIACPWLIRRFVDPDAVFLYVDQGEVLAVAEKFDATPFDMPDVYWSHRDDRCTFDTMVEEFGLLTEPLLKLSAIVRGADTQRLDLTPQSAGFLAACLGLSRIHKDDLKQLEAGMVLCDAFYRWCRDAVDETHNWTSPT